ncbi:MAG: NADH-quinone oxidoreductase subunit NuoE [Caldithrix sp.]|nr:NADH-quinone oxidoreductase subunit NuoE [Caldithrix sp.]
MLSEQEQREIKAEFAHYPQKRAACIEALKVVQKHRGWVSDDGIKAIADFLDMSPEEVDNVATFYNLVFRKPVGRHVILICDSISCWVTGYEQIKEHLFERLGIALGETTKDNRFTLLPMACLGACDHAPVIMIDDDLYHDLTPEKIDQILENYE